MGFLVNQSHELRNCRNFRHWLIAVPGPAPYFFPYPHPRVICWRMAWLARAACGKLALVAAEARLFC